MIALGLNEYNAIQEDRLFDVNSRLKPTTLRSTKRIVEMTARIVQSGATTRWTGGSKAGSRLSAGMKSTWGKNCYVLQLGVSNAFAMGLQFRKDDLMSPPHERHHHTSGIQRRCSPTPIFEATGLAGFGRETGERGFPGQLEIRNTQPCTPENGPRRVCQQLVTLNMLLLSDYDDKTG